MLPKRISKPPQSYYTPLLNTNKRKKKKVTKSVKSQLKGVRCHYQVIPNPTKYTLTSTIYQLYGDLCVTEHKGSIVTDLALINNFKRYSSVSINHIGLAKVVTILPESLGNSITSSSKWKLFVQRLKSRQDDKFVEWGRNIETYCTTFEQIREIQMKRKRSRTQKEKEADLEITRESERIKTQFFSEHPCLLLKRRFRGNDFQLVEISFSEIFLGILGYSIDTYASLVLKEGLPQFEAYNEVGLKVIMDNFSQLGQKKYSVEEYTSNFILKCGYIRKVTYEVYHLLNYEDGIIGLDTVVVLLSKESPEIDSNRQINRQIKEDFLMSAVNEDEEAAQFFKAYYNETKTQRYKHIDKVCQIRELPILPEEEIIINIKEFQKFFLSEDDQDFADETSNTGEEEADL